jgi:hypothetical protein
MRLNKTKVRECAFIGVELKENDLRQVRASDFCRRFRSLLTREGIKGPEGFGIGPNDSQLFGLLLPRDREVFSLMLASLAVAIYRHGATAGPRGARVIGISLIR